MRFDDSLRTVLAADVDTPFGAAAAWRQLVDLIGRGRVAPDDAAMARLREIRSRVPAGVRAASARALSDAAPGLAMAVLFAEDDAVIAAPVLRAAVLSGPDWVALLPLLSPENRAVLRHRRDLPVEAVRALESYGPIDFVLNAPAGPTLAVVPMDERITDAAPAAAEPAKAAPAMPSHEGRGNGYPVTDLMARIAAYQRDRETAGPDVRAPVNDEGPADAFRFETDVSGVVRWVDGTPRAGVVGLSLADVAAPGVGGRGVDAAVAGAFRRRSAIMAGRLVVGAGSAAEGAWRIAAEPRFDPASGRFAGYRGEARRPRADEQASFRSAAADGLRQLVHELRTPANAIAGFAELIEHEVVGPVSPIHRARAVAIREQAAALVLAIDDLDTAARIEGGALELRPDETPLAPLLARVVAQNAELARARDASVALAPTPTDLVVDADARATERLVARLLSAVLALASPGERLGLAALREASGHALLTLDRPRALRGASAAQLFALEADAEVDSGGAGAPTLGLGFSLRLVQSLAGELGGALDIEPRRLTLRLPLVVTSGMDLASSR